MNRKDFFKKGLGRILDTAQEKSSEILQTLNEATKPLTPKQKSLAEPAVLAQEEQDYLDQISPKPKKRKKNKDFWSNLKHPPGAIPDPILFANKCTSCGDCIAVCPYNAIFPFTRTGEERPFPYLDPNSSPCMLCESTPCIQACQTGALLPLPSPHSIRLGKAKFLSENCLNTLSGEETCTTCKETCPVSKAIRWKNNRPEFTKSCTGCGQCTITCPSFPKAIRVP